MFVCGLALVNRRVSEHHVPQDEHATGHTAPRLFVHLCTEVTRARRRGVEQRDGNELDNILLETPQKIH